MRWARLMMASALVLAGCARHRHGEWPPPNLGQIETRPAPPLIVTPAQGTAGRITSVNSSARYVVIFYSIGVPLLGVEQRLNVYRAGLKVAEIKITGPSRDTNTIADIVAGECQAGDEVRGD